MIGLIILGLFVVIVIQIVGISLDDVDDMAGVNIPIVLIILGLVVGMFALVKWRPLPSRTQSDEPTPDDSVVVDRDPLDVTTSRSKRLKQLALENGPPYIESVDYDQHFESDSHGFDGVLIGNELKLVLGTTLVDIAKIDSDPPETFGERAETMFDGLVDAALTRGSSHPEYGFNRFYLDFHEEWHGYSGVATGSTIELRHNDRPVNTATIELHPSDTYAERAQKIYDDLVEEALANET